MNDRDDMTSIMIHETPSAQFMRFIQLVLRESPRLIISFDEYSRSIHQVSWGKFKLIFALDW